MLDTDVLRYLDTFETLRKSRRWSADADVLRFAALSLVSADLSDPAAELEEAAVALKQRAGWFRSSSLSSSIRYAIAALILRRGLAPGPVHDRIEKAQEGFRARRFRRGGVQELLAGLILVLQNDGRAVSGITLDRMKQILDRWKKDHPWLTGTDDYPMAALHAQRGDSPESIAQTVEAVYEALRSHGFRRGNPLQLASHVLCLASGSGAGAARRFDSLAAAMKLRSERVGTSRYDELALLTLTTGAPRSVIDRVLAMRDQLRQAKSKPSKDLAFSLATGLALSREAARVKEVGATGDIAAVSAAQAILDAQSAAMAAVIASTVAATAATTAAAGS